MKLHESVSVGLIHDVVLFKRNEESKIIIIIIQRYIRLTAGHSNINVMDE